MITDTTNSLAYSQAHILIEIEAFVKRIMVKSVKAPIERIITNRHYDAFAQSLPRYLSVYNPKYDYSEHLTVFWHGCHDVGLLSSLNLDPMASFPLVPSLIQLVSLVRFIVIATKDSSFLRRTSDRLYQTKTKNINIRDYALSLHNKHSRLLVVRVDFSYLKEHQPQVRIDDVYRHLATINSMRSYRAGLFQHSVGSAWCIEQGEGCGYHIHALYYFLGSKHMNDHYMAQQLGDLWVSVSGGLGKYHSCNTTLEKSKFENLGALGVGMIYRDDRIACMNSINAIDYLADPEKTNQ